jgi:hypothetical protein
MRDQRRLRWRERECLLERSRRCENIVIHAIWVMQKRYARVGHGVHRMKHTGLASMIERVIVDVGIELVACIRNY